MNDVAFMFLKYFSSFVRISRFTQKNQVEWLFR